MSQAAIAWAMKQDAGSMAAKVALLVLAAHADGDGYSWPGNSTIARECGMHPKTVRPALQQLQLRKLIVDTNRRRGANNLVRVWWLGCGRLAEAPQDQPKNGVMHNPSFDGAKNCL